MDYAAVSDVGTPGGQGIAGGSVEGAAPGKALSPAAHRALAEAAARREEVDREAAALASTPELHGRGGLDPVRYADWEIGGRAVDF